MLHEYFCKPLKLKIYAHNDLLVKKNTITNYL